jgi:hypothetical protein
MSSTSTSTSISIVEEHISVQFLVASPSDAEGLVTDPVTQDLIKNPVFLSDQVWEADTISTLRTNAINAGQEFWVHPLSREQILCHLNPVHTPRLTQVVKSIVDRILPQETAQATLREPGQVAEVQGGTIFPSDLLKDEKDHYVLVKILQLTKSIGWENSIGWGKRYSWFNENLHKWFYVDQKGMLSR